MFLVMFGVTEMLNILIESQVLVAAFHLVTPSKHLFWQALDSKLNISSQAKQVEALEH